MKKITTHGLMIIQIEIIFLCTCLVVHQASANQGLQDEIFLAQGWDHKTRQKLSYTSFGSRFIPYTWFIALEQPETRELFRDNRHMASLGFITAQADEYNPDGLPVGLVRDSDKKNGDYIGLTCAACHTGQVSIQGKRIRIDGGQSLIDFTEFEHAVLAALKATVADPEKFSRFFEMINTSEGIKTEIVKGQLQQRIVELERHYAINKTDVPYGKGRLDAFGQIFNAIAVEALHIPENTRAPDAPTSYPVLWDASHLNVVQWNASAPNKEPGPLFQNAITALAVFGTVSVPQDKRTYESSIRISNLGSIQREFYQLVAPQWPTELAGALDAKKIAAGKLLYNQHCVQCHNYVDPADKKRKLTAVITPLVDVGTDPLMNDNFKNHTVKSGVLEGKSLMIFAGDKIPAETNPLDLVTHTAAGALFNQPWQTFKAIVKEYQSNNPAPKNAAPGYKARPINGIWASAPYLHNGSVPTIYDLLLPASERPVTFYVGNIELDVVKVGLAPNQTPHTTFFDTRLRGNSNAGHEYGTQLNDEQRWELVEYIKSL
ncbi:MAG TPA: di-heme-cytochrome C peroxidase [Cellvibrio sp.]